MSLILRYKVEGMHSATFTASNLVSDEEQAIRRVMSLSLLNHKAGYKKYSNAILYDENNKKIKSLNIQ